ncbi:MAG: hypothetical protein QY318_00915 [Candidatus Dojkabacteria bacterium]|nr:MAG: hypothetical protein QY318_00915 [Candidatus Dojkabacteria bacterium]
MKNSSQFETYKKLSKACHFMLSRPEFYTEDIEPTRDTFLKGLNELLLVSLDHHFDAERLTKVSDLWGKDRVEFDKQAIKYIQESVENDKTYVIVNRYMAKMLVLFIASTREEFIDMVDDELERLGVDSETFKSLIQEN